MSVNSSVCIDVSTFVIHGISNELSLIDGAVISCVFFVYAKKKKKKICKENSYLLAKVFDEDKSRHWVKNKVVIRKVKN